VREDIGRDKALDKLVQWLSTETDMARRVGNG
jgi:formate dehydrogenase assembly factor FdhD